MAQQDIRYYLNGLLVVVEDRQLKLVATDGHRLAYASLKLNAELSRQEVIVPRKTVLELVKLLADSDEEVNRAVDDAGGIQLRHGRGGVEAGRREVSGLHARHPDAAQEPAPDGARAPAPGPAASRDPFEREIPWRALGADRGQPETGVVQRRAGGGAGRSGCEVLRRRARYRV